MRVKVRNTFRDKITRKLIRKNTEIDVTPERFAEINGTPSGFLVEEVAEVKAPAKKKKE